MIGGGVGGRRWRAGRRAVSFLLGASVLAGCGSGGSPSDGGIFGRGGSQGSGGAGGAGAVITQQSFLGTWTAQSGTLTFDCSGQRTTLPLSGALVVWQMGTTSDLVQVASSSWLACPLQADVTGDVANALIPQDCSMATTAGTADLVLTNYEFIIDPGGTTASDELVAGDTSCTYSEGATYNKSN
jgi:hypothetical protein